MMAAADCNNSTCCKKCESCPNCYNLSIEYLTDILYAIDKKISDNYDDYLKLMRWGYGCIFYDNDMQKLQIYKDSIKRFYHAKIKGYESCLCPSEIQPIIERTIDLIDIGCCTASDRSDIAIDTTNLEGWILNNPSCVVYEVWERHARKICPNADISVIFVPQAAKILFSLKAFEIVREKRPINSGLTYFGEDIRYFRNYDAAEITATLKGCEHTHTISTEEIEKCKMIYSISATTIERCLSVGIDVRKLDKCKINYDLLAKSTNCNFDFDTYVKLLSCNMTHDIISELTSCGVDIDFEIDQITPKFSINGKTIYPSDIAHLPTCGLDNLIEL